MSASSILRMHREAERHAKRCFIALFAAIIIVIVAMLWRFEFLPPEFEQVPQSFEERLNPAGGTRAAGSFPHHSHSFGK